MPNMKTLFALGATCLVGTFTATPAYSRDWNIEIGYNDQVGANWNAHTVKKHIGKSDAELRTRVQNEGIECASSYWYQTDANSFINSALKKEDEMRARYGYPSIDSLLAGMSDGKQIILKQYNFSVNPAWFYGIYTRSAGKVYSANGIRVVLKKVPSYISADRVIVEVSFPDLDPAYSYLCAPDGVR